MSRIRIQELEARDIYRLVDRATYVVSGGRLKLGSDVWATKAELDVAEERFDPLNAPLCDAEKPLTIALIAVMIEKGESLPEAHRGHAACREMYSRLEKKAPSRPDYGRRWQERRARKRAGAVEPVAAAEADAAED